MYMNNDINKIEKDIDLLKESMEIISTLVKEQENSLDTIENIENEIKQSSFGTKKSIDELDHQILIIYT